MSLSLPQPGSVYTLTQLKRNILNIVQVHLNFNLSVIKLNISNNA